MDSVNNVAVLCGNVSQPPRLSHTSGGMNYLTFPLEIQRLSGAIDTINIIAREKELNRLELTGEERLHITGEIRSFNNKGGKGSRLVITVLAKEMYFTNDEDCNSVRLNGVICKPITLRKTPMGRLISDIMLAVSRRYGRSDYLPCIAWGRIAQEVSKRDVGDGLCLIGRMQSRQYIKATKDGTEERTAYEVSIVSLDEE